VVQIGLDKKKGFKPGEKLKHDLDTLLQHIDEILQENNCGHSEKTD
jgi:enamine deaminase RidA (YjgF/YER057c/UK114 family)